MKILNSYKIDRRIQKVVETTKGYIINGHYYDKATMSPRALEFFPTYGDPEYLATNQKVMINSGFPNLDSKVQNNIIIDSVTPSISYIFTNNVVLNNNTLIKIKEQDDVIKVVNCMEYGASLGANTLFSECVGQDNDYIYCIITTNVAGKNYKFYKISKSSLVATVILDFAAYCSSAKKIFEDDGFIYLAVQKRYGALSLFRYAKSTSELKDLGIASEAGNIDFSTSISKPKIVSESHVEFYAVSHRKLPSEFYINKYILNPKNLDRDIISVTPCEVTWSDDITTIPLFTTPSVYNSFDLITCKNADKEYLVVCNYTTGNSVVADAYKTHGFYTFLIDNINTNQLSFKNVLNGFPEDLRGFVTGIDNSLIVTATKNSTYFLNFDKIQETFGITEIINNQPTSLGTDIEGNIWVINGMSEVDMYSPYIPTQVKLKFEKSGYYYEGVDIDSYISIEAFNYSNENIEANLELTLKGNAVFSQNSTKIITEKTGLLGVKQIPIKVTGAGSISIYTKVII